ncbi:efflux RND transporter periplasmic adaptor subunit [Anaerotignum faecicola]|nr:efflux RND transporter periplasmic adaptor subunit [Anaerotignum faecicola]
MKKKKIVIAVALLAVAAVGIKAFAGMNSNKETGVQVLAGTAQKKDIEELLTLKAPLEGTESIDVVSRLHYEITSIYVKEGDRVKAGQVIAELDPKDLEEEIEKLRDNLELLRIQYNETNAKISDDYNNAEIKLNKTLEDSQREYEGALETLEEAQKEYDRIKSLYEGGGETKANFEAAETKLSQAQRAVDAFTVENGKVVATQAQLDDLKNSGVNTTAASTAKSIEIAEKELERKMQDLEDCKIKSSIDGTVTRVNAKVGRFADEVGNTDNVPMFTIENIDVLKMDVDVSEYDIGKIAVGQNVTIGADILGDKTVKGSVSRISPTGEEKSGTSERFIPIQIDVDGNESGLIAGINATAKVQVAKSEGAIVVPIEAIFDNNDGTYAVIKIKEDNTLEKVPVELGVESVLDIEIISDKVQENDRIVLSPTPDLTDGMSVIVSE